MAAKYDIREYLTSEGDNPYRQWLDGLKDKVTRARVQARILRMELGNFGDHKSVGDGVFETKLDFGPGYRVYFGRDKGIIDPPLRRRQAFAEEGHKGSEGLLDRL